MPNRPSIAATVASHARRIWGGLRDLGIAGTAASLMITAALAATAHWRDKLPLSMTLLIVLVAVAVAAFAYHRFVLAHRITRFNPSNIKDLGRELTAYARNASRTLNNWETQHPRPARDLDNLGADWDLDRRRTAERGAMFWEIHLPEAVAHLATLKGLEIHAPFHVITMASDRPESLVLYLGAVGQLLERGLAEEARALTDQNPAGPPPLAFHVLR